MQNIKIAVTGGIGSGKYTVAEFLRSKRLPVFSCDQIYHKLIKQKDYLAAIEARFPNTTKDGKLLKEKLSQIVFTDKDALEALNSITHPLIIKELEKEMEEVQAPFVFAEVPLLFEGKFDSRFDRILVVLREKHSRIHAIMKRDRLKETCIIARMNNQFDYDRNKEALTKNRKVFLINNNDSQEALEKEVSNFLKSIGFDCETNSVKQ